jgi:hypothetical protein
VPQKPTLQKHLKNLAIAWYSQIHHHNNPYTPHFDRYLSLIHPANDDNDDNDDVYLKKLKRGVPQNMFSTRIHTDQPRWYSDDA